MGLERSGLAITVERYVMALRAQGYMADGFVISRERHQEHGNAIHLDELSGFTRHVDATVSRPIILWIGLHSDPIAYSDQLRCIWWAADRGATNVVLPERTGAPEWAAYGDFIQLVRAGTVTALMHLNEIEANRWLPVVQVPAAVARPPLPRGFFDIGHERVRESCINTTDAPLIFIGRLSRRKGFDRLMDVWPTWRLALSDNSLRPRLHIYGRSFPGEARTPQLNSSGAETDGIHWQPNFPSEHEMRMWPPACVGITLSRQEFDGIAVSELLACGIPVLASPTSGHRALALESTSVQIMQSDDDFLAGLRRLFAAPDYFDILRAGAVRDIFRTRSLGAVGARLADLLRTIT